MLIISESRSGGSFEYWYPTPLYPLSQAAMRDSNLFPLNLNFLDVFLVARKVKGRAGSLVVGLKDLLLGNQLVVAFNRHVDGRDGHAERAEN
jgi:hypothetical protein